MLRDGYYTALAEYTPKMSHRFIYRICFVNIIQSRLQNMLRDGYYTALAEYTPKMSHRFIYRICFVNIIQSRLQNMLRDGYYTALAEYTPKMYKGLLIGYAFITTGKQTHKNNGLLFRFIRPERIRLPHAVRCEIKTNLSG